MKDYNDFCAALLEAGFSLGGGRHEGVFSLISFNWNDEPLDDSPIRWHTGDPDTDPWVWRMRVLDERRDIAYAKVFFRKSGYITKEWYPYFLAARRENQSFEEAYAAGQVSHFAKRIYEAVSANSSLPSHDIKRIAGFSKEENSAFDRALTDLQMKLYLTMCGEQLKLSKTGEEYGWSSTVFCSTEVFWGEDMFRQAAELSASEAGEAIRGQVLRLNPAAAEKKIAAFIKG